MAQPKYEKTPVKKATPIRKPSAKSSTTKHGNGIKQPSIEDVQASRYRQHVLAQQYTKKDLLLGYVIVALVSVLGTVLISALYWR